MRTLGTHPTRSREIRDVARREDDAGSWLNLRNHVVSRRSQTASEQQALTGALRFVVLV
jgi:hypothetical protein